MIRKWAMGHLQSPVKYLYAHLWNPQNQHVNPFLCLYLWVIYTNIYYFIHHISCSYFFRGWFEQSSPSSTSFPTISSNIGDLHRGKPRASRNNKHASGRMLGRDGQRVAVPRGQRVTQRGWGGEWKHEVSCTPQEHLPAGVAREITHLHI